MPRSRRAASTPFCSRKSSFSEGQNPHARRLPLKQWQRKDQIDHDALAAEWGVALEAEQQTGGRERAPAGSPRATPRPWRRIGRDHGRRRPVHPGHQGRRRTHSDARRNRLAARLQPRRHLAQRQFRHPRDHRLGDGLLRAPADAGNRLRPAGPADDDEPAQFHLRQRRSLARPHHLGALRRLSQLDSAAGDPRRVQGRGVGQFRPRSPSIRT